MANDKHTACNVSEQSAQNDRNNDKQHENTRLKKVSILCNRISTFSFIAFLFLTGFLRLSSNRKASYVMAPALTLLLMLCVMTGLINSVINKYNDIQNTRNTESTPQNTILKHKTTLVNLSLASSMILFTTAVVDSLFPAYLEPLNEKLQQISTFLNVNIITDITVYSLTIISFLIAYQIYKEKSKTKAEPENQEDLYLFCAILITSVLSMIFRFFAQYEDNNPDLIKVSNILRGGINTIKVYFEHKKSSSNENIISPPSRDIGL